MKNLLLTFATLILASGLLRSQVQFGISLGTGITKFAGTEARDWGSANADASFQLKFQAGIFATYPLSDKIFIETGLYYAGAGTAYKGEIFTDDITYRKQLSYLALPILFNYRINEKISAFIGPRLGVLLSAVVVNDASQSVLENYSLEKKEDAKDYYKATDFGIDFGLGYMISDKIGVRLSSDLGLVKIATYNIYYEQDPGTIPFLKSSNENGNDLVYDVKNLGVRFSFSYWF